MRDSRGRTRQGRWQARSRERGSTKRRRSILPRREVSPQDSTSQGLHLKTIWFKTRHLKTLKVSQAQKWLHIPQTSDIECTTGRAEARIPEKVNSSSHSARPVHVIIMMIKLIWTSRLSMKNSLSMQGQNSPHRIASTLATPARIVGQTVRTVSGRTRLRRDHKSSIPT